LATGDLEFEFPLLRQRARFADYTVWTAASDLKARRYYCRTYENSQIRVLDLMKMDLDAKDIVKVSIEGEEVIKPLNP
jgi:choloylglycine hydrolase